MIQINDLQYQIKKHQILKSIDLKVIDGEYFALAGINGAGKSTMIKLMLDLLRTPEQSMIEINKVSSWEVHCRDVLSYLPEKFQINKQVTGTQYLKFIAGVYQTSVAAEHIESLCEKLAFDVSALQKQVSSYSKGMMQKIGLISQFMLEKPLMILDEPLSGLDPKARYLFKHLLLEYKQKGLTVFYSTHMLADAEEICDQFAILDSGILKFVGSPIKCIEKYQTDTLEQAYMRCIEG